MDDSNLTILIKEHVKNREIITNKNLRKYTALVNDSLIDHVFGSYGKLKITEIKKIVN